VNIATLPEQTFDGATFNQARDGKRLTAQFAKVRDLMLDGEWRTLQQIAALTDSPMQSVSARLRDLRKERFGGYTVRRRNISNGLYEYQVCGGSER
jgi:hypothetical protein